MTPDELTDRAATAEELKFVTEDMYRDGRYLDQNAHWHSEDSAWKAAQIADLLADHGLAHGRVAEVGCGAGLILEELSHRMPKAEYVGYDISPDAQGFWEQRSKCITYHREDLTEVDEQYDLVLCIDVFEHVDDYMGFLRALRDRAGQFVFHIPLEMHVSAVLRDRHLSSRADVGHLHYFSAATAEAVLTDCGFEVIERRFTSGSTENPGSSLGLRTKVANFGRRSIERLGSRQLASKLLGGYSLLVLAEPGAKY